MKTNEQIRESILHPKLLYFPRRWWEQLQHLPEADQQVMVWQIAAYTFSHKTPDCGFDAQRTHFYPLESLPTLVNTTFSL